MEAISLFLAVPQYENNPFSGGSFHHLSPDQRSALLWKDLSGAFGALYGPERRRELIHLQNCVSDGCSSLSPGFRYVSLLSPGLNSPTLPSPTLPPSPPSSSLPLPDLVQSASSSLSPPSSSNSPSTSSRSAPAQSFHFFGDDFDLQREIQAHSAQRNTPQPIQRGQISTLPQEIEEPPFSSLARRRGRNPAPLRIDPSILNRVETPQLILPRSQDRNASEVLPELPRPSQALLNVIHQSPLSPRIPVDWRRVGGSLRQVADSIAKTDEPSLDIGALLPLLDFSSIGSSLLRTISYLVITIAMYKIKALIK